MAQCGYIKGSTKSVAVRCETTQGLNKVERKLFGFINLSGKAYLCPIHLDAVENSKTGFRIVRADNSGDAYSNLTK